MLENRMNALSHLLQSPGTCLSIDGHESGGLPADQGKEPGNAEPDPNGGQEPQGEKTFSQEDVNRIVNERLKRANASFDAKIQATGYSSIEELNAAAEKIREAERQRMEQQGQYKELLDRTRQEKDQTISEYQARVQALEQERESMMIDAQLNQAAQNSIAPGQVSALLRSRIRIVDGEPTVMDDQGRAMLDGTGNKLSIQKFVNQWLQDEGRHFLPAAGGNGAGSAITHGTSGRTKGYDPNKRLDLDHLRDPEVRADIIAKMKKGEIKM